MPGLPRLELASEVFLPGSKQLFQNLGLLRREPILKFIERLDRGKHRHGDFDRIHGSKCYTDTKIVQSGVIRPVTIL